MQIDVPQGKQFVNLPNGQRLQIPNGATKINIPDNMLSMPKTEYLGGYAQAPQAPQMDNRTTEKDWTDAIPFLKVGKDFAKDIAPDVKKVADQANSFLGLTEVADATSEAVDYNQKKADFDNVNFRYRDLLKLATEDGRKDLSKQQEEADKEFANLMMKNFGADDVMVNSRGEMAVVKDGKKHIINDSFWEDIKDGTWSSRGEIASNIGGGVIGGAVGNMLNKDPRKKAVSTILGGIAGDATASMYGRYVDVLRNAYNTRQELTKSQILDATTDAGGGNAILGVGATTVGAAIAKPSIYVLNRAKSFIADGNLEAGIKHIENAGYTREQAEQILKEQDAFSEREIPFLNTSKAKDQDMLLAVANQDTQLANDVVKELKTNMSGANGVLKTVDDRAKNVIETIQKHSNTPEEIQQNIQAYMDSVSKRYGETKEALRQLSPEKTFRIENTSIINQINAFKEMIGTVDGKEQLNALINRLKAKGNMDIADMIEARSEINKILSKQKSYDGVGAIKEIKDTLDTHIDELINNMPESELANTAWKEAVNDYRVMKDMQDGVAYQDIFKERATTETVDKALETHSSTLNKTLNSITSNLTPEQRFGVEARIIESVVNKLTTGKSHSLQAVDFPAVAEKLKGMQFSTPEAQEMVEALVKMGDMFKNDVKFLNVALKRTSPKNNQGLSYNVFIRARTMLANQFMGIASKFLIGEAGQSASFRHHVMQSLRRERTPLGFAIKVSEHPEAPAKAIEQLKVIAKQVDELNKEAEEAERAAREQDNAKAIAERDAQVEKKAQVEQGKKNARLGIQPTVHAFGGEIGQNLGAGTFTGTVNAMETEGSIEDKGNAFINGLLAGTAGTTVARRVPKVNKFIEDLVATPKGGVKANMFGVAKPQGTTYSKQLKEKFDTKRQEIDRLIKIYANEKPSQPEKVFRGVSKDGELINNSSGMASEGYGLYTTTNKKLAKDYGDVIELDGTHLPKNPLAFADYNQYEIFMQQLMYKIAGYKRASEFGNISPNEILYAINPSIDGIQIGKGGKRFWVKFPDINEVTERQNLTPNYPQGSFSDIPSKKAMYEIDDSKSVFNTDVLDELYSRLGNTKAWNVNKPKIKEGEYKPFFLKDILEHEELYKKYPQLRDMDVIIENNPNNSNRGSFNGQYIELNMANIGVNKETLLHEIQHAIQKYDGLPRGGNTEEFKRLKEASNGIAKELQTLDRKIGFDDWWIEQDELIKEMIDKSPKKLVDFDELRRIFARKNLTQEQYELWMSKRKEGENIVRQNLEEYGLPKDTDLRGFTEYENYKRLHGEQYARATSDRMNMTPEERMKESAYDTLKRVEGKVDEPIVKYHDGVSMSVEMENKYIDKRTGRVIENKIEAENLPQPIKTFSDFKKDFPNANKNGDVEIDYNGHKINFNLRGVFTHFTNNTNHQNRSIFSGAFHRVMQDPLIVVKQPHKNKTIVYKAFNTKDGKLHLASIEFSDGGFTFFDLPVGKVKEIIKTTDGNVIYYKYSKGAGTQKSILHDTKNNVAHSNAIDKILPQITSKNQDKPSTKDILKKLGL